ncbi:MAG: CBS domain-containing protein [Candidatus Aenigmarchaeota archaeon]|nr:CBS domain-containing protein [Candidatus Aenigmarchaeota archaeon]
MLKIFRRKKEEKTKPKLKIYRKFKRKVKKLLVSNLMTTDIIGVSRDSTLDQVVDLFLSKNISGTPVISHGNLIGEISKTDILKLVGAENLRDIGDEMRRRLEGMRVSEVMKRPICILEQATVEQAEKTMKKYSISRLIVLDKEKKLVGIITKTDLVKGISKEKIAKRISTTIDSMLEILEKKVAMDVKKLSKTLGVSSDLIEEWAKILEESGLIKIEYPAFGKPILRWKKSKIIE